LTYSKQFGRPRHDGRIILRRIVKKQDVRRDSPGSGQVPVVGSCKDMVSTYRGKLHAAAAMTSPSRKTLLHAIISWLPKLFICIRDLLCQNDVNAAYNAM